VWTRHQILTFQLTNPILLSGEELGTVQQALIGTAYLAALDNAPDERKLQFRAKQGRPSPFVAIRARNEDGLVPWDGQSTGELDVREPLVARAYYNRSDTDRFTDASGFRTRRRRDDRSITSGVERVHQRDTGARHILHIARHEGQAVDLGRCRQQSVDHRQRIRNV